MKRRINRVIFAFLLTVLITSLVGGVALAYLYRAPVSITENASTSYDMLPVIWDQNNTWLADNGFMSSTANDTRVQTLGGPNKPWMVADNKTLTTIPVPADSQTNLYFVTGESEATAMDIIVGYGGSVNVIDDADWELGDNFTIELSGYIDTSYEVAYPTIEAVNTSNEAGAVNNHDVSLPAGIEAGDLLIIVFTPGTATACTEPAGWTEEFEIDNGGVTHTALYYKVASGAEGATAIVTTAGAVQSAHYSLRISGYTGTLESATATGIDASPNPPNLATTWGAGSSTLVLAVSGSDDGTTAITAYPAGYGDTGSSTSAGAGGSVVGVASDDVVAASEDPGAFTLAGVERWVAATIGIQGDHDSLLYKTGAIDVYISGGGEITAIEYSNDITVTATGVSTGEHTVAVTADGTDLKIYVDSVEEDSAALGVASVPNNANDWVMMLDTTPYLDYYQHTVGGVLVGWFQPNDIVEGTTLPDREPTGGDNDGTITWGSNPAGVGVTLGSMSSSGQPDIGATSDTSTSDILPVVGGSDWNQDPDISGTLAANPLRPIVTAISDNTTLSERQVWVWFGGILVVFILVLVGANVRGHHLITGIAVSAVIILMVVWTIFPLYALIAVVLAILAGLVSERSPSL